MNPFFGFYSLPSWLDFGSGMDINQINRARKKAHRAKMYRVTVTSYPET